MWQDAEKKKFRGEILSHRVGNLAETLMVGDVCPESVELGETRRGCKILEGPRTSGESESP